MRRRFFAWHGERSCFIVLHGSLAAVLLMGAATPAQGAPPASPAAAPASSTAFLLARARYWYERRAFSDARAALEQAQRMAPDDPDVIEFIGEWALNDGRPAEATAALRRLQQIAPDSPALQHLSSIIRLHRISPEELEQIRSQARSGETAEAARRYQALFPQGPPPQYALEYYTTLAGVPSQRAAAQAGLARILTTSPNNMAAQIAYAQSLTWTEGTRVAGIQRLQRLGDNAATTAEQREQILRLERQAILWLPATPQNAPVMSDWLRTHPDDTDVLALQKRAQTDNVDQGSLARMQGYHDLDSGNLDAAAASFEKRLATAPQDADALGGLGVVRLRQKRNAEAVRLLNEAIAADPAHADHWRQARDGAQVGSRYEDVRNMVSAGNFHGAEQALAPIIAGSPGETGALLMQADIARRAGEYDHAIALYRRLLASHPSLALAQAGLVRTLLASGQTDAAARALNDSSISDPRLRASIDIARADRSTSLPDKIQLLRQAVSNNGSDPWVRLHLAQALVAQGTPDEAREVMAPLLAPGARLSTEQLQAVLFYAGQTGDSATIERLRSRLPAHAYTPEIRALFRQAEVREAVRNAPEDPIEARLYFMGLVRDGDPDGALGALIGNALLDRNDRAGASEVLNALWRQSGTLSAGQRLAYAGIEMRMGDLGRARRLIAPLREVELSSAQASSLQQLQTGLAVAAADAYNAHGERAKAYDVLAPALNSATAPVSARLALARLYQSDGQLAEAYQINAAAVERDPSDLDARLALVETAVAMHRFDDAQNLVEEMNGVGPSDPRSWIAAATLERARGNWTTAVQDLAQARTLRSQQIGQTGVQPVMDENPFRQHDTDVSDSATSGDPMLQQIDTRLNDVTQAFAPTINITPGIDSRSGSGLNGLTALSVKADGSLPLGTGRLTLSATPTVLNSRAYSADDAVGPGSIGSTMLSRINQGGRMNAAGVALGVVYAWRWLTMDVGTSPLGFRVNNILGGVEVAPKLGPYTVLRLQAERRSIADSILSYAGLGDAYDAKRNVGTGATWGGVTRNRANVQIEYGTDAVAVYGRAAVSAIEGRNTKGNTEYEAGAGGSIPVYDADNQHVRVGTDLTWFQYDRNEYQFSYGNGGYFSPQSFFAVTFPVNYTGQQDQWSWKLGGRIGYQTYHSNPSQYFPRNPAMQSVLVPPDYLSDMLPGQSTSGLTGGVDGYLHYQLTSALRLGAEFSYQKAGPWNELGAQLSAHYVFSKAP